MKKIILIMMLLACSAGVVNAQSAQDKAVIEQITRAASNVKSMQCDFTQTKSLKMLNEKMVSTGRLNYQQPNKLRWEYTSPYKYTFVLNGSQVLVKKGARADKIDVNQSKVFKEIARVMMNTVTGKSLDNSRDFTITVTSTASEHVATMVPKRKDMRKMFKQIKLHYNRKAGMVMKIELIENNGDNTVIELKNVKTNVAIPASTFNLN